MGYQQIPYSHDDFLMLYGSKSEKESKLIDGFSEKPLNIE